MSEQEWHYASPGDASPSGPVSLDQLRALFAGGSLPAETRVWTEGMTGWETAAARPELFGGPSIPEGVQQLGYQSPYTFVPRYAGFWLRVWAAIIDYIITAIGIQLINRGLLLLAGAAIVRGASGQSQWTMMNLPIQLSGLIAGWLYAALLESGPKQATLGKMALGIVVVDEVGARISFGRATGRHFAKFLSAMILGIGYLMAGWTQRKQALHDLITQTLVVRSVKS